MITRRIVDEDPEAGMRLLHENLMEWLSQAPDVDRAEHQRLGKLLKNCTSVKALYKFWQGLVRFKDW